MKTPPRVRLKYACEGGGAYGMNVPASAYVGEGVRLLRTSDLAGGKLAAEDGAIFVPENAVEPDHLLRPNDLLLSRSGTVGRAFLVPVEAAGMTYAGFLVRYRTGRKVVPRYAYYCTQSAEFQSSVQAEAITSTIQNFNAERYNNLAIPLPSLDDQLAVADYLDRETARIDTLIEEQQRLIAMLRERRDGVVTKAFLDSAATETKLKYAVDEVTVGIVVQPSRWYVDDGVPALRGLNVRRGSILLNDVVHISEEGHEAHPKSQLRSRDVVVVRTGQAGAAAKVPDELDGVNAIDILIIRPGEGTDPDFLVWYLNSPLASTRIALGSVGAIQGHFNVGALRELPLPVLSRGEQHRITAHLDEQVSKIDRMVEETERFIELAKERRAALITAAVTGQIDDREAA